MGNKHPCSVCGEMPLKNKKEISKKLESYGYINSKDKRYKPNNIMLKQYKKSSKCVDCFANDYVCTGGCGYYQTKLNDKCIACRGREYKEYEEETLFNFKVYETEVNDIFKVIEENQRNPKYGTFSCSTATCRFCKEKCQPGRYVWENSLTSCFPCYKSYKAKCIFGDSIDRYKGILAGMDIHIIDGYVDAYDNDYGYTGSRRDDYHVDNTWCSVDWNQEKRFDNYVKDSEFHKRNSGWDTAIGW